MQSQNQQNQTGLWSRIWHFPYLPSIGCVIVSFICIGVQSWAYQPYRDIDQQHYEAYREYLDAHPGNGDEADAYACDKLGMRRSGSFNRKEALYLVLNGSGFVGIVAICLVPVFLPSGNRRRIPRTTRT